MGIHVTITSEWSKEELVANPQYCAEERVTQAADDAGSVKLATLIGSLGSQKPGVAGVRKTKIASAQEKRAKRLETLAISMGAKRML